MEITSSDVIEALNRYEPPPFVKTEQLITMTRGVMLSFFQNITGGHFNKTAKKRLKDDADDFTLFATAQKQKDPSKRIVCKSR